MAKDDDRTNSGFKAIVDGLENYEELNKETGQLEPFGPEQQVRDIPWVVIDSLGIAIGSRIQFNRGDGLVGALIVGVFYDGFAYRELRERTDGTS